jgi:DNA modification methylase
MFSVKGDTVLDPFLNSGTTVKVAMKNERSSIGYEKGGTLLPLIDKKTASQLTAFKLERIKRED